MLPITTDADYAPAEMQNVIRCICSSSNPFRTTACKCRRHGVPCLPACAGCRGENCGNSSTQHISPASSFDENCDSEFEMQNLDRVSDL